MQNSKCNLGGIGSNSGADSTYGADFTIRIGNGDSSQDESETESHLQVAVQEPNSYSGANGKDSNSWNHFENVAICCSSKRASLE